MRDKFKYRNYYIITFVVLVGFVLILQLFNLQVIKNYSQQAESNAYLYKTVYASRGIIYDRNNKSLVFNQPIYDIDVEMKVWNDMAKNGNPIDTSLLCQSLGVNKDYFIQRLNDVKNREKNPGYSRYTPQRMITQLSVEEAAVLQEIIWQFPGVRLVERFLRQYNTKSAANILGYIGEVSKKTIKEEPNIYRQGDYVGISGVEKQYEKLLRGENGREVFLRDVKGRIKSRLNDGKEDILPVGGKTLNLTLDIDLQSYGELLMQNKLGSIVAIEPSTGEILALVSSPTYNLSTLTGKQRSDNYSKLKDNPYKPLINRALMAIYPPGSTFKTANALVFEQEQIIYENTRFSCSSGYVVGNFRLGCHAHMSPLDLANSISNSCNAYYCVALRKMLDDKKYGNIRVAFETWKNHIVSLGFGYRLGVDLPSESRGYIPNSDVYDKIHGKDRWKSLNIVSISIGQGEVTSTPLQLANLSAIIANRGYWIRPHILKKAEGIELDTTYTNKQHTTIDSKYFEPIIRGMDWAINGGGTGSTARIAHIDSIVVCGKTGTAENPHGKNHSIFIAFAPKDKPTIAIAVIVENSGFGATWAAPIASLMIEKYIKGEISEKRKWMEKNMTEANLMPAIKQKAAK